MRAIRIAVDAGHGSDTAGKRTPPMPADIDFEKDGVVDVQEGQAIREHWANVGVAYYVAYYLKKWGFDVVRTGWDDRSAKNDADTPLWKRQETIQRKGCLLSVSCHFNAHGDGKTFTSGRGIETLIHSIEQNRRRSAELAEKIQARISGGTKQKDRGVRSGNLAMCNAIAMGTEGSVLCEYGFMTNMDEALLIGDKSYWKECGNETALGIRDYLWQKPKDTVTPATASRAEVIWIQIKLRLAGEDIMTTGIWDDQTVAAVQSFWKKQRGRSCTGKKVSKDCIRMLA